ncbi:MAG: acyl-CoA carboxylase epsilon subunit [Egibacteraceae bacterium]
MTGAPRHLRVVAGTPTAEEIAAVVVALGGAATDRRRPPRPPAAAWARAARREALGARAPRSPQDLLGPL